MSTTPWLHVLLVALLGAAGALARWYLARWTQGAAGPGFPVGTLAVNVLGSFAFGLVYEATRGHPQAELWRLALLVGFCGGLTTFSTFAFDVWELGAERSVGWAAANVALHLGAGLAAVVAGLALGRLVA